MALFFWAGASSVLLHCHRHSSSIVMVVSLTRCGRHDDGGSTIQPTITMQNIRAYFASVRACYATVLQYESYLFELICDACDCVVVSWRRKKGEIESKLLEHYTQLREHHAQLKPTVVSCLLPPTRWFPPADFDIPTKKKTKKEKKVSKKKKSRRNNNKARAESVRRRKVDNPAVPSSQQHVVPIVIKFVFIVVIVKFVGLGAKH